MSPAVNVYIYIHIYICVYMVCYVNIIFMPYTCPVFCRVLQVFVFLQFQAVWRVLELWYFDVQLLGGLVLHKERLAEMKTGRASHSQIGFVIIHSEGL